MNKVTGRFFAPCRNVKRRSRHPVCRVSFCVFVWSLARRSSHRLCQPVATRRQEGWKNRQKTAWIPLRSGRFEMQEKRPRDRGKGLSPAPGQRVRTGGAGTAPPDPQPVRIKEHRQLLPFCQQLQPSSAARCSPPPSQMAGRTPHAVSY